jgi:hypothetical protein
MTDFEKLQAQWEREELPRILTGEVWSAALKADVDAAFDKYSGLEGLRGPFYVGVESCNCEGTIPNIYPADDPKRQAFSAGYKFGSKRWG